MPGAKGDEWTDEDIEAVKRQEPGDEWTDEDIEAAGDGDGGLRGEQGKVNACECDDDPLLDKKNATLYRAVAARLNYLSPDRPDIAYSVKEAARAMSAPRESHMARIKKLGRYLKGRPRLICKFGWQETPEYLTTYTDSDWAGCKETAKSTSGGIVCLGEHMIKAYCRQQKVVALSSAEAELYGMVAASAETMAIQAYAQDLGLSLKSELYTDSSAALGIAKRAGIGKVRHLRTQGLWIQETRISGRITYKKVLGEKNPADLLTKYMAADLSLKHLRAIHAEFAEGRAETAPEIGSTEIDDAGDRFEDINDGDIDGEIMSWTRKFVIRNDRPVRFNEIVKVRPIPAVGLGKSCRGTARTSRRGRWPNEEAAGSDKATKGSVDIVIGSEEDDKASEGIRAVKTLREVESESSDQGSTERKESGCEAVGSHEPHEPAPRAQCKVQSRRWADMDSSDSDDDEVSQKTSQPCNSLERTSGMKIDESTRQDDYEEIIEVRRCSKRRSTREGNFDGSCIEHPERRGGRFCFSLLDRAESETQRNDDFIFADLPSAVQSDVGMRSGYDTSCGARRIALMVNRPTRPAIRGSALPIEHRANFENLRAAHRIGPHAWRDELVDIMHFRICRRGSVRNPLSLCTNGCVCTHVQEADVNALPCFHSCLRNSSGEHRTRCAGSSPLVQKHNHTSTPTHAPLPL